MSPSTASTASTASSDVRYGSHHSDRNITRFAGKKKHTHTRTQNNFNNDKLTVPGNDRHPLAGGMSKTLPFAVSPLASYNPTSSACPGVLPT